MSQKSAVALALVLSTTALSTTALSPAFAGFKTPILQVSPLATLRNPGGPVTLNPQPLPPGGSSAFSKYMLNPQPLPPRIGAISR
jgi:hypothetical protein